MKIDQIRLIVEGVTDMEEVKTNLCLIGADWTTKKSGKGEVIIIRCDDGRYQVLKGGRLCRLSK